MNSRQHIKDNPDNIITCRMANRVWVVEGDGQRVGHPGPMCISQPKRGPGGLGRKEANPWSQRDPAARMWLMSVGAGPMQI